MSQTLAHAIFSLSVRLPLSSFDLGPSPSDSTEKTSQIRTYDFGVQFSFKGELNPEIKLSQSIELFVTKRLPPIRSLSDVWFSSCAS